MVTILAYLPGSEEPWEDLSRVVMGLDVQHGKVLLASVGGWLEPGHQARWPRSCPGWEWGVPTAPKWWQWEERGERCLKYLGNSGIMMPRCGQWQRGERLGLHPGLGHEYLRGKRKKEPFFTIMKPSLRSLKLPILFYLERVMLVPHRPSKQSCENV